MQLNLDSLRSIGLASTRQVYYDLPPTQLVEHALRRGEGVLTHTGALRVSTGERTGRSPKDRFIVKDSISSDTVDWGKINVPMDPDKFENFSYRVTAYLQDRELFVFDGYAGADKRHRLPVRIVNEYAWHNLFANQLFIKPTEEELKSHEPEFTVVFAPGYRCIPEFDGSNSEVCVAVSFERKLAVIAGTAYAGESKKSIFSVMNYLMPQRDIFPMHCSANIHHDKEETALFFGLSGTGKTTLSADPHRRLIGDDEHGWSKDGIFNFEGGCYAKCIDLTEEREPVIMQAIKFGAVIENVVMDDYTRVPDYKDASITENTRVGYPLTHVPDATFPSIGGHPSKVVFLTCDAFGVLPPISKLTPEQAMYHFMSGYTAKLAGTEMGVTEPQAAFSTCFGAPFMPLPAVEYAHMLGDRIREHQPDVFLVNTGWSGGAYGEGSRMSLPVTRALVTAAVEGGLEDVEYETDPIFGLHVPTSAPGVSDNLLMPSKTWKTQEAYDEKATLLAGLFHENFKKFGDVPDNIKQAGPKALTAAS